MVTRVFEVEVYPQYKQDFNEFFIHTAAPLVRSYEGLEELHMGVPLESQDCHFLMVSIWSSVDSLKVFAGEAWKEAVIDPREEHMIKKASVRHYQHVV